MEVARGAQWPALECAAALEGLTREELLEVWQRIAMVDEVVTRLHTQQRMNEASAEAALREVTRGR